MNAAPRARGLERRLRQRAPRRPLPRLDILGALCLDLISYRRDDRAFSGVWQIRSRIVPAAPIFSRDGDRALIDFRKASNSSQLRSLLVVSDRS